MTDNLEALAKLSDEILDLVARDGIFTACSAIESNPDEMTVARVYSTVAQAAYVKCKNVPMMAALATAGIHFCLRTADARTADSEAMAPKLKETAKVIAYNMAANTWPGWGDEGIVINPTDLAAALEAATVSLRLVEELDLGSSQVGNAHWIIGALHLAAGTHDKAIAAFVKSRAAFADTEEKVSILLAEGFIALTKKARRETREIGAKETEKILIALKAVGTEDAGFYAEQIETADRILVSARG